ncbi:adenylate cyclase [Selenomonas sp. oral taxon 126]|uniref:CYTH domain-containing protein n=1 Tax=Selenomonas sp. oral taxon 126 TaxID=712528 RepID=UPI0008078712|nr:CYTH domain-containing protein [Selenomonas sp. oral taxon 126]ANR70177.1 adenylate cyclase [Selenomonas sp. oral taxon 126]
MGVEIERKFKVKEGFRPTGIGIEMAQGYLSRDPKRTVRIRRSGMQGYLTIKGETHGAARLEYEYEIPAADAEELLALCEEPLVEKTRYRETVAGHVWEVDVFHGANAGLIVAEIELSSEAETFVLPTWAGAEVTGLPRYYNAALIAHPYNKWSAAEHTGVDA